MAKKPSPGRPSVFSEVLAQLICDRLADGESLRKVCASNDMPDRSTVMRWQIKSAEFAAKCAHARGWQADLMDDLILDTANACTPETAAADRVKISAYQWRAAKLAPKKYGDRTEIDLNVSRAAIEMSDGELEAIIRSQSEAEKPNVLN